eukprot:768641-Hanusia_phi.AAC.4
MLRLQLSLFDAVTDTNGRNQRQPLCDYSGVGVRGEGGTRIRVLVDTGHVDCFFTTYMWVHANGQSARGVTWKSGSGVESPESGAEMSKAGDLEKELAELHSRYKQAEEDRDGAKVLKKQRASIERLRKDTDQLRKDLDLDKGLRSSQARSKSALDQHASMSSQLNKLQDQAESYTKRIETEKKRIEELDSSIKDLNEKVLEQRKKVGGANAVRENNLKSQKHIQLLENRLDKSLLKFNEALANNKQLRESIDNLRREKQGFDQIYKKLEKDLSEKKSEMQKIIEMSNVAYEVRDKAQQEMAMLKIQADREQASFEAEWKELGKLIEDDRKMKELMRQREKAGIGSNGKFEDEDKLRKKIMKGNTSISKDKAAQQAALHKVQSYEEAFAKIQASTGISDIDELVATFIEAEDKNFSLFNYVNELNNEVEKLEEQIADTRSEIEKHRGKGQNNDNQRKQILIDLEDKLAKTEAKAEQFEARASKTMQTMNVLKQGIQVRQSEMCLLPPQLALTLLLQDTFNKIGCNAELVNAVAGNQGVTESNMMQYLGIIEQRTNEILQMYTAAQMRQSGHDETSPDIQVCGLHPPCALLLTISCPQTKLAAILGQGPQVPLGSGKVEVVPPPASGELDSEEGSEEEEEEDRPLTRDELKAKTLRSLAKREMIDREGEGVAVDNVGFVGGDDDVEDDDNDDGDDGDDDVAAAAAAAAAADDDDDDDRNDDRNDDDDANDDDHDHDDSGGSDSEDGNDGDNDDVDDFSCRLKAKGGNRIKQNAMKQQMADICDIGSNLCTHRLCSSSRPHPALPATTHHRLALPASRPLLTNTAPPPLCQHQPLLPPVPSPITRFGNDGIGAQQLQRESLQGPGDVTLVLLRVDGTGGVDKPSSGLERMEEEEEERRRGRGDRDRNRQQGWKKKHGTMGEVEEGGRSMDE